MAGGRRGELGSVREARVRIRSGAALLAVAILGSALPVGPGAATPLRAQAPGPTLAMGGLLRTGARFEPEDSPRHDGFEVFDARLRLGGEVGIIFDYFFQAGFEEPDLAGRDGSSEGESGGLEFELLDARLTLPFRPELMLSAGQFKAPFGGETLLPKDDIRFLERALASRAIAPGRQVGVELHGEALEGRLAYRGGAFNGTGRGVENDGGGFLYAARLQYNTVGPIEFYEDLVVQVGGNLGFSSDSAVRLDSGLGGSLEGGGDLPPGVDLAAWRGDRLLLGFDWHTSYRGWELNGEYLRVELDPAAGGPELDAWGGYLEGVYGFMGAVEATVRYDFLRPVAGPDREFVVAGVSVFPGFYARFGIQYALGVGGSPDGPGIADDQLILLSQLSF